MMNPKQAIVFTSFGTTDAAARERSSDAVARDIAAAFSDYAVVQAYTSQFILRRLAAQNIAAQSLPECLADLAEDGFSRVLIQPAHFTPGEEYENKILAVAGDFADRFSALLVGEPVFFREGGSDAPDDYAVGLEAIARSFPAERGEELVLLGHGSPHRHNPVYEKLQRRADEASLPIHIGVVEPTDTPNFSDVLVRLQKKNAGRVLLAPLLFSGGVHVTEDMAGEGDASWRSRLAANGFSVRTELRGLGEFPAFRRIYLAKIRRLAEAE